jgi:pimeloyl-ACP methyl ester carboxylesterase
MDPPESWDRYTVHSRGADLQCYRTGDGPSILLAHAWSDSSLRWAPLVEDLPEDYEIVAYDARGHGRSDATKTGYNLDGRIADLRAVARESGLDDPVLIGHSMGVVTVARTAARHPDLARGVVLEDPVGIHGVPDDEPDERVARVRNQVKQMREQSVEDVIADQYQDFDPDQARRLAEASLELRPEAAEIVRTGYPSPLDDVFPDITSRTLVLRRDVDIETRVKDLDAADNLPDGRLIHIPDAGHYVFQDAYDAAYVELQTFLRRV